MVNFWSFAANISWSSGPLTTIPALFTNELYFFRDQQGLEVDFLIPRLRG